jgi:CubicO group peptidase (beta-lactamase class C family)
MSQFDAIWMSLDETIARGHAPGMVAGIRHGDETEIYECGYRSFDSIDPMESTTPFRIASLSKLFAGAIAALMIDDGIIALDDPVSKWLPELAKPKVLKDPAGPLKQALLTKTPITVEHLLTLTNGIGVIFEDTPLSREIAKLGIGPDALPPQMTADEYMARVASLPLAYAPGERFLYSMGTDILSVLLARASGMPLSRVVQQRIADPLGMTSTGFYGDADELPTAYVGSGMGIDIFDYPDGPFSKPPQFEALGSGLVSTVPDYLKLLTALADGTLLPRAVQKQMLSPHLSASQLSTAPPILPEGENWGWQVGVTTAGSGGPGMTPGTFGWQGGTGTAAFVDPVNDIVACIFTQRMMTGPEDGFDYFMEPLSTLLEQPQS